MNIKKILSILGTFLVIVIVSLFVRQIMANVMAIDPLVYEASYFNNKDLSGTPILQRQESRVDYEWGLGSPDPSVNVDYFSARWTTTVVFDEGSYEFSVTADDGVRLWIDNELVIDKWILQSPTTYKVQKNLSAGSHSLKMEYYENTVDATAKLSWTKYTPPENIVVTQGNFLAQYFNNTTLSDTPVLIREETAINYSWGSGSPDPVVNSDNFSALWTAEITMDSADYEFTVTADDGVRFWVDGVLLIDQWKDQPPTTYSAVKSMTAGNHIIDMEYYEKGGGATAKLSWTKLEETAPLPPPPTGEFSAEYFNNTTLSGTPVLTRSEAAINYEWGSGSPDPSVNSDNFSARWIGDFNFEEGSYEFSVTADDGVRLWVDNVILIDQWKDQAPTTYKAKRTLSLGSHTVRMEYYEKGGGATAKLSWSIGESPPAPISISPGSFGVVVLPDTQKYAKDYPNIFTSQTQWIVDNKADLNIQFVLHVGDIVDDPNSQTQWLRAQNSLHLMDGVLPYFLAAGNHEMPNASNRDTSNYNYYFPYSKYNVLPHFGGVFESNKMDNAYYLITSGGVDFLIISLEFGPRNAVLDWANQIVQNHPSRKAIMLTHDYVYDDDTLHGSSSGHIYGPDDPVYGLTDYNTGVQIWEKFVKKHSNMLFAFSGHVYRNDGAGLVVDIGENGNTVYQMLSDYQHYSNGGNGYLRFLEINPTEKFVKVKTYSPYLNEFLTSSAQQFQFTNVAGFGSFTPSPLINSVKALDKNTVEVKYSRDMDKVSSENTSNYALDPVVAINQSVLQSDLRTVILTTNDLTKGAYRLTINNVKDSLGNLIAANSTYDFAYSNTSNLSVRVSSSSDDAEELASGATYFTSTDLELVYDDYYDTNQTVGIRFINLGIPRGAKIVNAYIQFTVDELNTRETNINIFAESISNSSTFGITTFNISGRPKTVNSVNWLNINPWQIVNESNDNQKTPDISVLIQEVINLDEWQSGNAISLIMQGTGKRVAHSYDGSPLKSPLLYVEWEN